MVYQISCVVTRADGSKFYEESHGWYGIDADGVKMLNGEVDAFAYKVKGEQGKKDDGENLSGTFTRTVDGVSDTFSVSDVSYKSLSKLQREWHHAGDRVIKEGEKRAKSKK